MPMKGASKTFCFYLWEATVSLTDYGVALDLPDAADIFASGQGGIGGLVAPVAVLVYRELESAAIHVF